MAELGETSDPKSLVPGDTSSVDKTAWSMTVYGDLLHEAGAGLQRIDTTEGWSGEAADQFRSAFDGEPTKWMEAGDCFHASSKALKTYTSTLVWAQEQAAEAILLWEEGQAATRIASANHDRAVKQAPPDAPRPRSRIPAKPREKPHRTSSTEHEISWNQQAKSQPMPLLLLAIEHLKSLVGRSKPRAQSVTLELMPSTLSRHSETPRSTIQK